MKPSRLLIPKLILDEMRAHVQANIPEEACGLLGGRDEIVSVHLPVTNILHDSNEFRMDAEQQIQGLLFLEKNDIELLAIYHSHPLGPCCPSQKDLSSHLYPEAACIILAKEKPEWVIQAFWITQGSYSPLPLIEN